MSFVLIRWSHRHDRVFAEDNLALLKRQHIIDAWHDRRLLAGTDFDTGISENLEKANIILLLISADFLASDYCYSREITKQAPRA